MKVELPSEVWKSVMAALEDFQKFGPGELDAEYIPEDHLDRAIAAIRKVTA